MEEINENTSDGFHTFKELYAHRHALFIALMRAHPKLSWRAKVHEDGTMYHGWIVAGIDFPTGVITYHLPAYKWRRELKGIRKLPKAPHWDGHTPDDVVKRLRKVPLQP